MTVALFSALNCQVNEYKTAKQASIPDIDCNLRSYSEMLATQA